MHTLNHTALNWLKEFITLCVNTFISNFILLTFNTFINNSKCLHFHITVHYSKAQLIKLVPLHTSFKINKDVSWPCLWWFCCLVCLGKWSQINFDGNNFYVKCPLIPTIDALIHYRDKDTLFGSCNLLYKLPFIRMCALYRQYWTSQYFL